MDPAATRSERLLAEALERYRARRWRDAEALCLELLASAPRHAAAWDRLGHALEQQGRLADAADAYRTAAVHAADPFEPLHNAAVVLRRLGQLDDAVATARRTVELRPAHAAARSNLGALLRERGRLQEAVAELTEAVRLDPAFAPARVNLGLARCARGEVEAGLGELVEAVRLAPDLGPARSSLLLCLQYADAVPPEVVLEQHRAWGRRAPAAPAPGPRPRRDRLRVGFVSGDLRRHSVAFFLEPLLEHLDRERFEPIAYATSPRSDEVTARLRALFAGWRDASALSDEALADEVRRDAVDVLVDLAGHTEGHRLGAFALRAAPLQVTWLGYPHSTGLPAMDVRLSDAVADPPPEADRLCTERLVRLDRCFLCYRPPAGAADPARRPGPGPTFGSFNALAKLSPTALQLFTRVLAAVPGARLLLKDPALSDPGTRALVSERLARHGLAPERLELRGVSPSVTEHLAAYGDVDVALDAFPYGGTTTTCDALWMGVPVVTLRGGVHASRVGASLLGRVGLGELVAGDPDAFVRIASDLGAAPTRLRELRGALRGRLRDTLCDGAAFARDFERALRRAWAGEA